MHTHVSTYWEYSMRAANNAPASGVNKVIGKGIFYTVVSVCVCVCVCVWEGATAPYFQTAHNK